MPGEKKTIIEDSEDFALDVESFASTCRTNAVTFRGSNEGTKIASAVLVVSNPTKERQICKVKCTCNSMFQIRPAVFALDPENETAVKLTYFPEEYRDKPTDLDERLQWFIVHHITSKDSKKSAIECWAENRGLPDYKKLYKVRFEERDEDDDSEEYNDPFFDTSDSEDFALDVMPSERIFCSRDSGEDEKFATGTLEVSNPTKERRACFVKSSNECECTVSKSLFILEGGAKREIKVWLSHAAHSGEEGVSDTETPFLIVSYVCAPHKSKDADYYWNAGYKRLHPCSSKRVFVCSTEKMNLKESNEPTKKVEKCSGEHKEEASLGGSPAEGSEKELRTATEKEWSFSSLMREPSSR